MRAAVAVHGTTLIAFGAMVFLVGANIVAIRVSNRELAPFWNAGLRFGLAAVVFVVIVRARRLPLPRGRALVGAVLYGLLGFAGFFAFAYFGLVGATAGLGAVVFALVPMLTLLLALVHRLETMRWRTVIGGVVAAAGISVAYGGLAADDISLLSLAALVAAAVCGAETNIIVKRLPPGGPVAANAVATSLGAAILIALSILLGEPRVVPAQGATLLALAYLVPGTVVAFLLLLFVLQRWSASAASYEFVLAPIVAVVLETLVAGQTITPTFVAGAALVLGAVYFGALAKSGFMPDHPGQAR